MKKVILLLVDSLMPNILEDCMRQRTVPALQFLKDKGRYWSDCVTVFPTMTTSVDSSLVTGVYPHTHRVPGLVWYDPEERKIVNYINGWKCVYKLGVSDCAENVLYNLNEKHLSKKVTTIFEELASHGRTTPSINTIVHRGIKKHRVHLPLLLNIATRFRLDRNISGPDVLTLGALVENSMNQEIPSNIQDFRRMFGINDEFAVHVTKWLIQSKNQPDFMLVYLPDNDHEVHKKNPDHAEEALIRVDRHVQEILNVFDSWDDALRQCVFIVTSDHGQTRIGKEKEFNIDLDVVLQEFRVLQLGDNVNDHDLVVCNNERMAYLYPLELDNKQKIVRQLLSESRIDLIAWKKDKGVLVTEGGTGREVYYEPNGPYKDIYGLTWDITGERIVLDLLEHKGVLQYGDYPDVLSRLYGALYSQDLPMIVITARPRYEFKSRYYPMHLNGGSHGSLHKFDSMIPLLIAGTDMPISQPPRLVDLKNYIVKLLPSE